MNATTQVLLNMHKNFLTSMSSVEAADKGYGLVCRMIAVEFPQKALERIKKFEENVVDQVTNGEAYNKALRCAMYHYLPGSERILGMSKYAPARVVLRGRK